MFEYGCHRHQAKIALKIILNLASRGSAIKENVTCDPQFEGSNMAAQALGENSFKAHFEFG